MKNLAIILSLLILVIAPLHSQIIKVPTDQQTIQAGINTAINGDTVLVAEGTYYENINFKGKAIMVASNFILDQDTSHISKTIIDGSKPSDPNKASVVTFESGEDTNSVLMGFTITGGTGTHKLDNYYDGGGILVYNSVAKISNNIIKQNIINVTGFHSEGGGISCISRITSNKFVIITNNKILQNKALTSGDYYGHGAGIYVGYNNAYIFNNEISENQITKGSAPGIQLYHSSEKSTIKNNTISFNGFINGIANGGGMILNITNGVKVLHNSFIANSSSWGGGLDLYQSIGGQISNNLFDGNTTTSVGGGIFIQKSSVPIEMNKFINNHADTSGGAICVADNSNPEIKNNLIVFNEANFAGGIGIYFNSNPKIINNSITKNKARCGGGAFDFQFNCKPVIMNSIIYGNTADSSGNNVFLSDSTNDITFTYCDIEGGIAEFGIYKNAFSFSGTYENNMDYDPLFAEDSLFKLADGSPCIDAGNPDPIYNDDNDSRNDIGHYGGPTSPVTGVKEIIKVSTEIPSGFKLSQNFPNPFNPTTTMKYSIPENVKRKTENVKLIVYDILGREIAVLVNKEQKPGNYEVKWAAGNQSSGVYFYRIITGNYVETKKMVLLR